MNVQLPLARRILLAAGLLSGLLVGGVFGYQHAFHTFQFYDDEGYQLYMLSEAVGGKAPYTDVQTPYGPLMFDWQALLFRGFGLPVNHAGLRWQVWLEGLVAATLLGWAVGRMTARPEWALVTQVMALFILSGLMNEPGHVQGVIVVAMAGAVLATTVPRMSVAIALLGASAATLALGKINSGAFQAAAVGLTLTLALRRGGWPRHLWRMFVIALAAALPFLLMQRSLAREPGLQGIATSVGVGILFLAWQVRHVPILGCLAPRAYLEAALGGLCAAASLLLGVVAMGSSLADVFQNVFIGAYSIHPEWLFPPVLDRGHVLFGCGIALAIVAWNEKARIERWSISSVDNETHEAPIGPNYGRPLFLASARIIYGLTLSDYLLETQFPSVVSLAPASFLVLTGRVGTSTFQAAFPRLFLAASALCHIPYVYPIAGTQMAIAVLLPMTLGMVCLADGVVDLFEMARGRRRNIIAALAALVILSLLWRTAGLMSCMVTFCGEDSVPLDLPGTGPLALSERQVALYRWLFCNLKDDCDVFVGLPALQSMHFWTNKPMPGPIWCDRWFFGLPDDEQQRVVDRVRSFRQVRAYHNERDVRFWLRRVSRETERQMRHAPLMRYLATEFEPMGAFAGVELLRRRGEPAGKMLDCARVVGDYHAPCRLDVQVPALAGVRVGRWQLVDLNLKEVLADSRSTQGRVMQVELIEDGRELRLGRDQSLDMTRPRRLRLTVPIPLSRRAEAVVVRLRDRTDRVVTAIPLVTNPSAVTTRGTDR